MCLCVDYYTPKDTIEATTTTPNVSTLPRADLSNATPQRTNNKTQKKLLTKKQQQYN